MLQPKVAIFLFISLPMFALDKSEPMVQQKSEEVSEEDLPNHLLTKHLSISSPGRCSSISKMLCFCRPLYQVAADTVKLQNLIFFKVEINLKKILKILPPKIK